MWRSVFLAPLLAWSRRSKKARPLLLEIAALGGELVRLDALVARCFGHSVGGKGFQHHLELKRGCVGFRFLGHEIPTDCATR